jgi:hypothetical protein
MKPFRLRLRTLLWLVALAAAFLGGMKYGEYREARKRPVYRTTKTIWWSPEESERRFGRAKVFTDKYRPGTGP